MTIINAFEKEENPSRTQIFNSCSRSDRSHLNIFSNNRVLIFLISI